MLETRCLNPSKGVSASHEDRRLTKKIGLFERLGFKISSKNRNTKRGTIAQPPKMKLGTIQGSITSPHDFTFTNLHEAITIVFIAQFLTF